MVELDPFGWFIKDGRPVVWVWRALGKKGIGALPALQKLIPAATHWYFCGKEEWHTLPQQDVTEQRVNQFLADGFTADVRYGRRIDVLGRTPADIEREIGKTLKDFEA